MVVLLTTMVTVAPGDGVFDNADDDTSTDTITITVMPLMAKLSNFRARLGQVAALAVALQAGAKPPAHGLPRA